MTTPKQLVFESLCRLLAPLAGSAEGPDQAVARLNSAGGWPDLIKLASTELVIPQLAIVLTDGRRSSELPDDLTDYFKAVLHLSESRSKAIRLQLSELVAALNRASIVPLLLKGAAYEIAGLYEHTGARVFGDLDLLIPLHQLETARTALEELGYTAETNSLADDHHHLPAMTHQGHLAAVELHRHALRWQCRNVLSNENLLLDAQEVSVGGGRALTPSPTHLALHNILHAQVSGYAYWAGTFLLRDALDLAALAKRFPGTVAWEQIVTGLKRAGLEGVAGFYARLAFELFGLTAPPAIRAAGGGKLSRAVWSARLNGAEHPLRGLMRIDHLMMVSRRLVEERSIFPRLRSWAGVSLHRLASHGRTGG